MNPPRHLRQVLAIASKSTSPSCRILPKQCLHSSARRRDDRKPTSKQSRSLPRARSRFNQSDLEDVAEKLAPYTKKQREALAEFYSPAHMAAIEAGEAAIDPKDLVKQGAIRVDPMALTYVDSLHKLHPVLDKIPPAPEKNYDPNMRFKEEDELDEDMARWVKNLHPEDIDPVEWTKYVDNSRLMVGDEAAERNPTNYEAPELPKINDRYIRRVAKMSAQSENDDENVAHLKKLAKQTGLSLEQMRRLRTKVLVQRRVVNQTRLGKIQSMYFLTVAGNGRGLLGVGEGKSNEPEDAKRQAQMSAIRNMVPISRYEERTIYGDVKGKVGATELELFTRPPGRPSVWY